ncbi:MAG: class I SAM-dependent methyltransferase [Actinomycetota bacterium]
MPEDPTPRSDAAAFHAHSHGGIAFTGERVVPDEPGWEWCFEAHRFGYDDLIARLPGGARVLDVGCGEGYGTASIAEHAGFTVGCDASAEAVKHARDKYGTDQLAWVVCDAQALPFADDAFDVVASLQVIEHFTDTDAHLSGVARILRADGFHYCATPNIALATPEEADNEFHLRDFDAPQLEAAMRKHFGSVELLGQFYREDSPRVKAMRAAEATADRDAAKTARLERILSGLPGPLRVRARPALRRMLGLPAQDAATVRNQIIAEDFEMRAPASESFCLFAIARKPHA